MMEFGRFMREVVRVRNERDGRLHPPALHREEERIVEAMDRLDSDGLRQLRTLVISWMRKAGKSFMDGAIAVFMLIFDEHATHREVLIAASTRDQARNAVFLAARRIVLANPWLRSRVTMTQDGMSYVDDQGVEHVVRVLPNAPGGATHGLNGSCVILDELWTHQSWDALEGISPSPARRCPLTVASSYAGLRSQRRPGNPWHDTLTQAQQGDDPRVFLSHLSGREAALTVPWITESWLVGLERQFAHVRAKYERLGLNIWSTSDSGSFLTSEEIRDAVRTDLPAQVIEPQPMSGARLGVDLGLTRDRTAIVATEIASDGALVVRHVEILAGTPKHPVSLMEVEEKIATLARYLQTRHVVIDRWQSAGMSESLIRRHGLWVTPTTCDAAWLDRSAMMLKAWFHQRHIRIPAEATGLLEELETLEAEELRRRDRIRFTATGGNHDDAVVAMVLSAESFAGKKRPETSQIGRPKLAEIDHCEASWVLGQREVPCPMASAASGPTLLPGCLRCPQYQSVEPLYLEHQRSGQPMLTLAEFTADRFQANTYLRSRRFAAATELF